MNVCIVNNFLEADRVQRFPKESRSRVQTDNEINGQNKLDFHNFFFNAIIQ